MRAIPTFCRSGNSGMLYREGSRRDSPSIRVAWKNAAPPHMHAVNGGMDGDGGGRERV